MPRIRAAGPNHCQYQIGAECGRTPELLDAFDYQLGPCHVRHERFAGGIVHCVREITHENTVQTPLRHFLNSEAAIQNAHVRMHAHDEECVNVSLPQQIVNLIAVIGNGVFRTDRKERVLAFPCLMLFVSGRVAVVDRKRWISQDKALGMLKLAARGTIWRCG